MRIYNSLPRQGKYLDDNKAVKAELTEVFNGPNIICVKPKPMRSVVQNETIGIQRYLYARIQEPEEDDPEELRRHLSETKLPIHPKKGCKALEIMTKKKE